MNLFTNDLDIVLKKAKDMIQIAAIELYNNPLEFDMAVQNILNESGYYDLINNFIDSSYDTNYENIVSLFESSGLSATFTELDAEMLKGIKDIDLNFFKKIGDDAAQGLKRDLYKYSLSGMDKRTMVANMTKSLEGTNLVNYSETYANTAISNYHQDIIDIKSEGVEGEVYIYRGGKDKKTRDFCRCVVNARKYYDKDESHKLKNDKRREYNCRHKVIPVSEEYAISNGYSSGKFTC